MTSETEALCKSWREWTTESACCGSMLTALKSGHVIIHPEAGPQMYGNPRGVSLLAMFNCPYCGANLDGADGMTEPCGDMTVEAVVADFRSRSNRGIGKYGVTLDRRDLTLRDWLQHAYEESLDHSNYLKRAIMELDRATPSTEGR